MDLKRLPPSLLVALGLVGCGPAVDDGTTEGNSGSSSTGGSASTVGPCLDVITVGPCLVPPSTTVGPCLDATLDTTIGPCLLPPLTGSTGTGSGTGTDTDVDTDTDTDTDGSEGTDGGTTGGASEGQTAEPRGAILGRLLDAGVLPPDVASKLRAKAND